MQYISYKKGNFGRIEAGEGLGATVEAESFFGCVIFAFFVAELLVLLDLMIFSSSKFSSLSIEPLFLFHDPEQIRNRFHHRQPIRTHHHLNFGLRLIFIRSFRCDFGLGFDCLVGAFLVVFD